MSPKKTVQSSKDAAPTTGVSIPIPPSRATLVLGIDTHGRLYHEMYGEGGLVELGGLLAYGQHLLSLGFQHATQVPEKTTLQG